MFTGWWHDILQQFHHCNHFTHVFLSIGMPCKTIFYWLKHCAVRKKGTVVWQLMPGMQVFTMIISHHILPKKKECASARLHYRVCHKASIFFATYHTSNSMQIALCRYPIDFIMLRSADKWDWITEKLCRRDGMLLNYIKYQYKIANMSTSKE